MTFKKAVKHEAKLRMAIAGPSGSGKTYTSLAVATALANGKPIALVDTEHGSASKYADLFNFDVLELTPPFHPDRFVLAIKEAGEAGYGVIILDSLTHAWSGTGGLLEIVDGIAARMKTSNTFAAWKDATPIQNRLIEAIVSAPLHIVATMRSKQDYIQEQDGQGKTRIRKVGMAPQQREGFEYEFDVFMDMDIDNNGIVQKTRCPDLTGRVFKRPGADVASILLKWLEGAPAPQQTQTVTAEQPITQPPTNGNVKADDFDNLPTHERSAYQAEDGEHVWADWRDRSQAIAWAQEHGLNERHAFNLWQKVQTESKLSTKETYEPFYRAVMERPADPAPKAKQPEPQPTHAELDALAAAQEQPQF